MITRPLKPIGRPLKPNNGKGKEVWEYVRDALCIPETTTRAVITFDKEDVIRVHVEYFPVDVIEPDENVENAGR